MEGKQQSLSPKTKITSIPNVPRPAFVSHSRSASQPSSFFPAEGAYFAFNNNSVSFSSKKDQSGPGRHINELESPSSSSNCSTGGGNLVAPFSLLPPLSPSTNPQLKRSNSSEAKQCGTNHTDAKQMTPSPSSWKGHRRAVSEISFEIKSGSPLESPLIERCMETGSQMQNCNGQKLKRQLVEGNGLERHTSADELLSTYLGMQMDIGMEEDYGSDSAEDSEKGDESINLNIQQSKNISTECMTRSGRKLEDAYQGLVIQPRRGRHSHSYSMDSCVSSKIESALGDFDDFEMKKIMANDKLQELVMVDPKKVKRILANRQSAARSKERKMRYITELERKVHTLQTEATTLSAKLTVLQRDSSGLLSENNELKLRLQGMEQQAQLHEALNEALQAEVQRLKLEAAQINANSAYNQSLYPALHQPPASPTSEHNIIMPPTNQTVHHSLSCAPGCVIPGLMTSS